jgi:hypothetical protein
MTYHRSCTRSHLRRHRARLRLGTIRSTTRRWSSVKRHTEDNEYYERVKALEVERLNKERMERETGMSVERRRRRAFFVSQYQYRRPMSEFRAGGFYGCGAGVALFLDDHHYIEAMFEVYSQQRYRLL